MAELGAKDGQAGSGPGEAEEETVGQAGTQVRSSQQRWALLKAAILRAQRQAKGGSTTEATAASAPGVEGSVRSIASYGLVHQLDSAPATDKAAGHADDGDFVLLKSQHFPWEQRVFLLRPVVSLEAMMGFNNTGNVCIWPAEELLCHVVLAHPELVAGKSVLELGGGMAPIAGLACLHAGAASVLVTDGNPRSVQAMRRTMSQLPSSEQKRLQAQVLDWTDAAAVDQLQATADVVLAADCLFFTQVHDSLARLMASVLRPQGFVLSSAPDRNGTRVQFLAVARGAGLAVVEDCPNLLDAAAQEQLLQTKKQPLFNASLHLAHLDRLAFA
ncbi:uncharacterized protein MONBRDRAFT_30766 [Monosiga brevicollis MX1]|uniref:Calmodulin-lysine N-methyltransferase n=1 Tax=Monosiga brevicollis TaxID=81824 RepID=A9UP24_MONBE|nr:uncharacterized protein MONBRDRAFT_30766 [Monosiga brevicollis MX1]EDQ92345.1 predicted protein [Monosiga brevicollis MX1]|eukprot:XP_001742107.1 hypothetical protein [Monosiga brevicollis MX1]